MLKIAICDDISAELQHIVTLTTEYMAEHRITADIREFSHPDMLLNVCETEVFHIFLLDMVMPMISGLELGRSIRRITTDAQIIYITADPGYALDAYAVNPLHYLLKPVDRTMLFSALELATEKVNFGESIVLTFRTREGLRTLSTDVIAFCEYIRRSAIYTLISGEVVETTTLSVSFTEHLAPLLEDHRFIQSHAAFAVNMSSVERLTKDGFTLRSGFLYRFQENDLHPFVTLI